MAEANTPVRSYELNNTVLLVALQFNFPDANFAPIWVPEENAEKKPRVPKPSGRMVQAAVRKYPLADLLASLEAQGYILVDASQTELPNPRDSRKFFTRVRYLFASPEAARPQEFLAEQGAKVLAELKHRYVNGAEWLTKVFENPFVVDGQVQPGYTELEVSSNFRERMHPVTVAKKSLTEPVTRW